MSSDGKIRDSLRLTDEQKEDLLRTFETVSKLVPPYVSMCILPIASLKFRR